MNTVSLGMSQALSADPSSLNGLKYQASKSRRHHTTGNDTGGVVTCARRHDYSIANTSTSNVNVALTGITPGTPRLP